MEFVFQVCANVMLFGADFHVKSQPVQMIVVTMDIVSVSLQLLKLHLVLQNVLVLKDGTMLIAQNLFVKNRAMEMEFALMELVHALRVMKVTHARIKLTIYMGNAAINVPITVQCNANRPLTLTLMGLGKVATLGAQRNVFPVVFREITKFQKQSEIAILLIVKS